MRRAPAALVLSLVGLAGCTGPVALLLDNPIAIDHLDGNYQVIAACAYERLSRQYTGFIQDRSARAAVRQHRLDHEPALEAVVHR